MRCQAIARALAQGQVRGISGAGGGRRVRGGQRCAADGSAGQMTQRGPVLGVAEDVPGSWCGAGTSAYSLAAVVHRARARWYTTKIEPSYDMTVKLRRMIIAARFTQPTPGQATPKKPEPFSQPGPPPEHDPPKLRNTRGQKSARTEGYS